MQPTMNLGHALSQVRSVNRPFSRPLNRFCNILSKKGKLNMTSYSKLSSPVATKCFGNTDKPNVYLFNHIEMFLGTMAAVCFGAIATSITFIWCFNVSIFVIISFILFQTTIMRSAQLHLLWILLFHLPRVFLSSILSTCFVSLRSWVWTISVPLCPSNRWFQTVWHKIRADILHLSIFTSGWENVGIIGKPSCNFVA